MKKIITVSILSFTFIALTSFDYFKPSEQDLVGFWKIEKYVKSNESLPVAELDISLQCTVEGNIGKFSGVNGKNLFSGIYEIKSKKEISVKGLMTTKYDQDPVSESFIESFQKSSEFKLESNKLLLINSQNNSVIIFNKKD
ncbi:MAG: META domain-containing protein [Bacteroidota bacterium]